MTPEAARAKVGTVVAVVPDGKLDETVRDLAELGRSSAVRSIVISLGDARDAQQEEHEGIVIFRRLVPRYLNNAVASLRLSSLPATGWWRVDDASTLQEMAVLVDRLVLDVPDPRPHWSQIESLAATTSVGDIRWAKLTRWRDLLAQFFDQPELRRVAAPFERIELSGTDRPSLELYAGWLKARMPGGSQLQISLTQGTEAAVERIQLRGPSGCATLTLLPNKHCVQTSLENGEIPASTRVVPGADPGLHVLIRQELRIRTRDTAFEEAVSQALRLRSGQALRLRSGQALRPTSETKTP